MVKIRALFLNKAINIFLGGRFKKEVIIDGQSYLLLIRDEGGTPEMQVKVIYIHSMLLYIHKHIN